MTNDADARHVIQPAASEFYGATSPSVKPEKTIDEYQQTIAGKFALTSEQRAAIKAITAFLRDDSLDAFVLRGSAGTGKTTLVGALVECLEWMNLSCKLLAPTGRAARILGNKIGQMTGKPEYVGETVHKNIYLLTHLEVNEEADAANDPGMRMIFPLKMTEPGVSLIVIDESSMVGDKESNGDLLQFGSGRLLRDIVTYTRMKRTGRTQENLTKLLFVGDPVQLPPIGETFSPALSDEYLKLEFGLKVKSFDLVTVMRQAKGSAILDRATELRDALLASRFNTFSLRPNQLDIVWADRNSAINHIIESLQGKKSNVAVVYSNATALEYNRSIRERLWGNSNLPIQLRDTLLVNRNSTQHGLSNGDLVKVVDVSESSELVFVSLIGGDEVQLSFRDLTVAFRTGDGVVTKTSCKILENLLDSPLRELTPLEQRALLVDFRKRHPDLNPKSDEFRAEIGRDCYFNSVQVKYGYAMTCHKAQGGEWSTVVVDFPASAGARNASFFRWAYTAITRTTESLIVVNAPDFTPYTETEWSQSTDSVPESSPISRDISNDPDWNRFSFSAATAPLVLIHRELRAVWQDVGITIVTLQHLQYCERYTLLRDKKRTTVQYHYDKKFRLGQASAVPNPLNDSGMAEEALTLLRTLTTSQSAAQPVQFIQEFLARLDAALRNSAIQRCGYQSMPYRLRVSFADKDRKGDIDFTYDGSSTWTTAQEVGGPGGSEGLYDEVQSYMKSYQKK